MTIRNQNLLGIGIGILLGISLVIGHITYKHITEPNYYGFPAVNACGVCGETIWRLTDYTRIELDVVMDSDGHYVQNFPTNVLHNTCVADSLSDEMKLEVERLTITQ